MSCSPPWYKKLSQYPLPPGIHYPCPQSFKCLYKSFKTILCVHSLIIYLSMQTGISSLLEISQGKVTERQLSREVTSCHQKGGIYSSSPSLSTQWNGFALLNLGNKSSLGCLRLTLLVCDRFEQLGYGYKFRVSSCENKMISFRPFIWKSRPWLRS